jgi:hypothetical protein
LAHILYIRFAVIVVSYNGAEREEQYDECDEYTSPLSKSATYRQLGELNTVDISFSDSNSTFFIPY